MDLEGTSALAVYGTLAPGEVNHWVVRPIDGVWHPGTIRGWTYEITWGPATGFIGFTPDVDGNDVPVQVLVSDKLTSWWHQIDEFEGPGYHRVIVDVSLDDPAANDPAANDTATNDTAADAPGVDDAGVGDAAPGGTNRCRAHVYVARLDVED